MEAISSGHWSVDLQAMDALSFLQENYPEEAKAIRKEFPEPFIWSGSWLDTEAMGVDVEYGSWLVDAIEATGLIIWEDGEPWAIDD